MALIYELVGSIADHIATRVENAFDSDATGYQPPVTNNLWQGAAPVEPSQLPTGTDAEEDSRPTSDCEANTAAEGCANSHQAAGAAGSSTSAAIVAAQEQLRRLQCYVLHL
ncbi:hypothetical protein MRX96_021754 [Rhipicephalus microplus]